MPGFISLADAKAQLRIEQTDEDALILRLIDAASAHVEELTGFVAGVREGATFVFDRFERELEIRQRPVSVESIAVSYLDASGDTQTIGEVRVIEKHGTTRILPAFGASWPAPACTAGAVTVTADVGFADGEDGAAEAPEDIKQAVRLCLAHWFANREAVNVGNIVNELPIGFASLLAAHRLQRV
jgi:uncharacterized phiE125 gp8 family phage protein